MLRARGARLCETASRRARAKEIARRIVTRKGEDAARGFGRGFLAASRAWHGRGSLTFSVWDALCHSTVAPFLQTRYSESERAKI
jgi:hypothetical protein